MSRIVFEDFAQGQLIEGAPITVTRDQLIAFAREFDPQPFHLDEEAAKHTFVGRLIGSGWQTVSLGMRLLHRDAFREQSSMGSPGVEQLQWVKPILPGDALRARISVEETRASASKHDRGFVRFLMTLVNSRDEAVMTQSFSVMFAKRDVQLVAPRNVTTPEPFEPPSSVGDDRQLLKMLSDAEIGSIRDLGRHRFDIDAIVTFARLYDPQAMHLDAHAAEQTHFGGLCASGWHTAAVWMKRLHATWSRDAAFTTFHGECVPQLGPSPGFTKLRWLKPVYAGDTLRYATRLIGKRKSVSRPGWGLATHHNTAENQRGEPVFEFTGTVFWQWAG